MNRFLETHKISKPTQEVENLNKSVTKKLKKKKDTKILIQKLLQRKSQGQMASLVNSNKHLKRK